MRLRKGKTDNDSNGAVSRSKIRVLAYVEYCVTRVLRNNLRQLRTKSSWRDLEGSAWRRLMEHCPLVITIASK
jgi:hypothetical protein